MSLKRRRLLLIALAIVVLCLVSVLGAWVLAPALLTVDSGLQPADAILVLGGDPGDRTLMAIEIYETVQPRWVIISGSRQEDHLRQVMEEHGVPAGRILLEEKSTSTFENATHSVALLRERGCTNAVVVTSWFHSRRALATFQRAAPELKFYSCPTRRAANAPVWPDAEDRRTILNEYAKLLYYWVAHGVPPWTRATSFSQS